MICKNCIHYDVCQYHIDEETDMTVNECSHEFKHKDQYTRLPAFIGQRVWLLDTWYSKCEICEGKVSMLQQKADKSWKLRISYNGSVCDYVEEDIGKILFFNPIDAEVAVIKRVRHSVELEKH